VIDFKAIPEVCKFFELCEETLCEQFTTQFFRVLVELFANSGLMLDRMDINSEDRAWLIAKLQFLCATIPDAEQVCAGFLNGDALKLEYLHRNLQVEADQSE
jgi:hypothetical protein